MAYSRSIVIGKNAKMMIENHIHRTTRRVSTEGRLHFVLRAAQHKLTYCMYSYRDGFRNVESLHTRANYLAKRNGSPVRKFSRIANKRRIPCSREKARPFVFIRANKKIDVRSNLALAKQFWRGCGEQFAINNRPCILTSQTQNCEHEQIQHMKGFAAM